MHVSILRGPASFSKLPIEHRTGAKSGACLTSTAAYYHAVWDPTSKSLGLTFLSPQLMAGTLFPLVLGRESSSSTTIRGMSLSGA